MPSFDETALKTNRGQVLRRPGMCRLGTQEQMDGEVMRGFRASHHIPQNAGAGMSSLEKVELGNLGVSIR